MLSASRTVDNSNLSVAHVEPALFAKKNRFPAVQHEEKTLVIVDSKILDRECFAQSIIAHGIGMDVQAFDSINDWRRVKDEYPSLGAIVLNIGSARAADAAVASEVIRLVSEFRNTPVVVLADNDELGQILKILEYGAKGYIPTSVSIDVCVEAIKLALAGGIFVPVGSVLAMRKVIEGVGPVSRLMEHMFTQRQEEVVRALRRGKANKIIAYELNLRESTVKVHIRNIMKKLKATNRTEVAFKIAEMFPQEGGGQPG